MDELLDSFTLSQIGGFVLGLAICTGVIFHWNRGAQRRRFAKAFPAEPQPWRAEDEPFLAGIEKAYRLRRGTAKRLPPTVSPMALYLTLYPTHCIYDTGECERCLTFLRQRLGQALSRDALAEPLGELAARWHQADPAATPEPTPAPPQL